MPSLASSASIGLGPRRSASQRCTAVSRAMRRTMKATSFWGAQVQTEVAGSASPRMRPSSAACPDAQDTSSVRRAGRRLHLGSAHAAGHLTPEVVDLAEVVDEIGHRPCRAGRHLRIERRGPGRVEHGRLDRQRVQVLLPFHRAHGRACQLAVG